MGWIGCVRCKKFWRDFVTRTFALTALVQPVLQLASCSNETIQNAPEHYETRQNMSLASNGVDRVRSLRKIPMRLCGTNFCTSSARFAPSFVRQPNCPECTQTVWNTRKCQFMVQWIGSGAFVAKNSDATLCHEILHLFGPFCTEFRKATKQSWIHPKGTKCTKTKV